jgi:uncharacterized membrane protein YbaN (DUF454 family)
MLKHLLNTIGIIAVGLGVLGIFLPLLPTTPFLLLASACVARGSVRLHTWLRTNPIFGRYLSDWEDGKGIPARGKAAILIVMWASLGYSMTRVPLLALQILLASIGLGVSVYLLRFVPTFRQA